MLRRENASTEDVIAEREERMERMKKEEEKRDARPGEASDKKKNSAEKKNQRLAEHLSACHRRLDPGTAQQMRWTLGGDLAGTSGQLLFQSHVALRPALGMSPIGTSGLPY
jgi:hypothetical protein